MFKSHYKIISLIMCFVLVAATFSFSFSAQAKSTSELQNEREQIQDEINAAQSRIDELEKEKAQTQEYLDALMVKINLLRDKLGTLEAQRDSLQAEIDAIQAKIEKTEQELIKAQQEIDKKQAEFDDTYELYCQRLKAMYVSGTASTLEVLLTCPDMSTMLTRSQMINSVSKQDSKILDDLMKKMEEIEKKKQEFEIKRNELSKDKENLEKDKNKLQQSINEIDKSKSELDSQAAECNALMRKLSSQTSEYMEIIDTNEDRLRQVEDEIRATISNAGSYGSGSGQLRYPTDSSMISAGYPNYSSGSYHGGVDFPVSTGSNIYAASSGVVIKVAYLNYSYGYHIIIDHGDGLSTLYAHNSQIFVSTGQSVSAGQVIAAAGSTGNSTGPHCHFEVRVNGNRVNPMNYL